ncbi:MAG: hypothetical protein HQK96_02165, partial [Nitrospirae bacterium]|nr:hypothetical protein [Nitrospirota bacterium]
MRCPKCGFESRGVPEECPRCGIIFAKYRGPVLRPTSTAGNACLGGQFRHMLSRFFLHVDMSINPVYFYGRV